MPAVIGSFQKLDPRHQIKNPVMFVVLVGSALTTGLYVQALGGHEGNQPRFYPGHLLMAMVYDCIC